jgi:hypothetical protein
MKYKASLFCFIFVASYKKTKLIVNLINRKKLPKNLNSIYNIKLNEHFVKRSRLNITFV